MNKESKYTSVGVAAIIGGICIGFGWNYVKKKAELINLPRSMSLAAINGGKLALHRLIDYQNFVDRQRQATQVDDIQHLETLLQNEQPHFKEIQQVLGRLEVSRREDEAIKMLKKALKRTQKKGKSNDAYELGMLLAEMYIYKIYSVAMTDSYNFINDITPLNESMRIRIRILRLWKPQFSSDDSTLELIIMDEKGDKIQCTIKKRWIQRFESQLQEGACRVIKNFGIVENNGDFRFTKHVYRILFKFSTSVTICDDVPQIHKYGFDFAAIGDVTAQKLDVRYLIDVIGKLLGIGSIEFYNRNGEQVKKLDLEITDYNENTIKCTLWGEYAEAVLSYISENQNDNIFIIIQYGKIKKFRGQMSVSNSFIATRIMLNETLAEFDQFRSMFPGSSTNGSTQLTHIASQSSMSAHDHFIKDQTRKYLDEIRETIVPIKCVTIATIDSVDGEHGWFYLGCKQCNKKVKEEITEIGEEGEFSSTKFLCGTCEKLYGADQVIPRFKVQIRVVDESGSASFVLFDSQINTLLRKSAYDLRATANKDDDITTLPKEFDDLIGKKLIFKVEVSDYNLKHNWQVFTVLRLTEDPELIKLFSKDFNDIQESVSGLGETEGSMTLKLNDGLSQDLSPSNLKKRKTEVKIEK